MDSSRTLATSPALATAQQLATARAVAVARTPPDLHVICERDVGLFSLIQQVVANIPWALNEGRVPIAAFGRRTVYWTPDRCNETDSVWEYYFEPVVSGFPASVIPERVRASGEQSLPDQDELGHDIAGHGFVSNHFGDHPRLAGVAPCIPYATADPDASLRAWTSEIISEFVRPTTSVRTKAQTFLNTLLDGSPVIGVHIRGTDAVSSSETRAYRQNSLDLGSYVETIERLLVQSPDAKVFVATDERRSLDHLEEAFGSRVAAYTAVRHEGGAAAGAGPTGRIMPAYIAMDRAIAAQNGEDAVVEYLVLRQCDHLVHNGASLAVTALLAEPTLSHTNTHERE